MVYNFTLVIFNASRRAAELAQEPGRTLVRRRRAVYHEQIGVRLPPGVVAALDRASLNKRCSTSEYIRRLLLDGLDRDGVELPPPEPMT